MGNAAVTRQVVGQGVVNDRVYQSPSVVRHYPSDKLELAEALALLKYQPVFAGRDVLDLGVGTGRTAIYLAPMAHRYIGVDYSPYMLQKASHRLPKVRFELGDMRDLSVHEPGSFDFVFGTNNVLDAVSHEERLQVLSEVRRVLKPDGVVMFSAHNRSYKHAYRGPRLKLSRNPLTMLRNVARLGRQWFNYGRLRRFNRNEAQYALLTDVGHDYACLHYYIDREAQASQLSALGFRLLDVFTVWGASLGVDDLAESSPWLMYVATVMS